ncbi:ABC transporter substrate-binding protein [Actinocatenispora rupis]|uniref:ABC transporter substrate-binding protein n=1 Tax=Actinocatenispora rupis TaxID=519421 RepID=A0A8J3NB99_9ACTN|nr:ABC transporter substrate-binding protein [Actinocatenispora rupis]GID12846.1 ABC transporter substrate-binding protein [Actinocatenispora rupis]
MTRIPARRWGIGAAILALGAGAVACSPSPTNGGKTGESAQLVVARTADVDVLDPARATAFATNQTLALVYDRLVQVDANGKLVPGLATKWTVGDGGRSLTFTLRDGVKFHNGQTFTSADAKASLDRIIDPKTASVARSYLANVSAVDAPDPRTLKLNLTRPDASLLTALSYTGTSILSAKDIKAGTVDKKPDGTGPYSWKSWKQGQELDLAANTHYWNGKPKNAGVQFRVIPDEASIVSGMKAGSFSLGIVSDPALTKQLSTNKKMKLVANPTLDYHVLQLNGRRGPLKDKKVRQAIACAVNRKDAIDTVYFGQAKETGPIVSPAYQFDANAGLGCTAGDTAGAKAMLAKAGYAKGFHLKTIVMTGQYSTSTNLAQVLQSQLGKIGVTLDLDRQQTNVYVPNWSKANFDAAVALNGGSTDPYLQYNRYFTSDGSLKVPAGLADPKLDSLLRKANGTTDEATREQVFGDLSKQLNDDSPWVWLFRNQTYYLESTGLTGFTATPSDSLENLRVAGLA